METQQRFKVLSASVGREVENLVAQLGLDYIHESIDHSTPSVRGNVRTNGLKTFWCLLKRYFRGTHVSVEPVHLFRYLDEEMFRLSYRAHNEGERFAKAASGIEGRHLTYQQLTAVSLLCQGEVGGNIAECFAQKSTGENW